MLTNTGYKRKRLVLVVDDQEINQIILEDILTDDYELLFASNGQEALDIIHANAQELSVILLDLLMPVLDGFEVLRQVRANPKTTHIPIIVLTSEKEAELRALQLGAADFITKPFDMHEVILARVARIIELSEGRRLIEATELDPLTRLYSPGFFMEFAEQMLRYNPAGTLDAVMVNIDHFHSVNDLNGRDFGDRVLVQVADAIRAFLSKANGIAGRADADNFLIMCNRQDDYASMLASFQVAVEELGSHASLRLRMGVGPSALEDTVDNMFDHARTACNLAREKHSTHLMIYDHKMQEREMYHQRLLNDMQDAIDGHQFLVFYQPKYNIQTDPPSLASAEALVRWRHPELGMISPGDFIPLFEREGVIGEVDSYVRGEVIRQIAQWRDELGVSIPISVNLSRTEMFDPNLQKVLDEKMAEKGLTPRDLFLEVTESAYADDAKGLLETINGLRESGFEIEMDDFGSGYSSLNMLSSMPIDVLKMDMKFIQNIEENIADFRLVELILDIATYLQVPVVAEGVETKKQMEMLRDAGCKLVQGFYFSRPLPVNEFEQLMIKELKGEE